MRSGLSEYRASPFDLIRLLLENGLKRRFESSYLPFFLPSIPLFVIFICLPSFTLPWNHLDRETEVYGVYEKELCE